MIALRKTVVLHAAALGMLTLVGVLLLTAVGMPGAGVLASILAAMTLALSGSTLELPKQSILIAQALMGAMLGGLMDQSVLHDIVENWPSLLIILGTMLGSAVIVGWLIERSGRLPPGTGTWGSLPGAAPAMIMLADDFGSDVRFVALMQYLRVLVVVMIAALVSRALAGAGAAAPVTGSVGETPLSPIGLGLTLVAAVAGSWLAIRLRVPAGALIGPLLLGAALNLSGLGPLQFPGWMAWVIYLLIGWTIGLRFRRRVVGALVAALPVMLVSILALVLLSGISGALLVLLTGRDPMTAFLATSPGGLDSVAILALESRADVAFVLTLQTLRLFGTILVGALIARRLATRKKAT